jgi:hypothetical protein
MPPSEAEFHVVYSDAIRAALTTHINALVQAGWPKKSVRKLVATMDDRLRHSPRDFGEPLYTLRTTNICVSIGFVRPLAVQFGVHEESKSVFVRKIILMTTDQDG